MSSSTDGNVTSINATYLKGLVQNYLQPLLDEVSVLLKPVGYSEADLFGNSTGDVHIPPLNANLTVPAGNPNFQPVADLITALGSVGSSVNSDLTWFRNALSDTIDEINTTVASMTSTDDLNAEQAQTFMNDFSGAISAIDSGPTGGSGSGSSGSGGSGSGGSGSGSNG
jgi:hypothetical protein